MEGFTSQYSEKVMEHFKNPRNIGEIPDADGIGNVGNPVCVSPKTLVYINNKIEEIAKVKNGQKVLGQDGFYHTITSVRNRYYKGKIYSLLARNIGETIATPDHHILSIKTHHLRYKFSSYKSCVVDWYAPEELEKGDILLYPIPKETKEVRYIRLDIEKPKWDFKSKDLPERIRVNKGFLRLVGYYLSEGYVRTDRCKGTVGFVFNSREKKYVEDVILLMRTSFGVSPAAYKARHNSINLEFYSARLARFLEREFGKGAQNKFIPQWAMLLPLEKQTGLLSGLWRGDGYINNTGGKFVTISKQLAYSIRLLLLRHKIIFSFLTVPQRGIHKENYCIYVKEEESLKKLSEIFGKRIKRLPKLKNTHKSWFDENFYYTPIRRISTSGYEGLVYNLEVEEPHSYISNSAILHNCGDIMRLYIKVENDIIVDAKFKTFGCLPAEEEVALNPIGWERIDRMKKGMRVLNGEGESTDIVETYIRNYKGRLLRISPFVSPFNSFSVTPEHPVLSVKRRWVEGKRISSSKCSWFRVSKEALLKTKPDYINAIDLEIGDYLIFAVNKSVKDDKFFTKEWMRFLGYYLSEGYIIANRGAVSFAFNKNEKKAISEITSLIKDLTGKRPGQRIRGNVAELYVCSRKLANLVCELCGRGARNKVLSEKILLLPFIKQWEMIETYLIGDGNRYRRRPGNTESYRIITTSKNLAIQVQQILARGGIFASIRRIFKTKCRIDGRLLKDSVQYLISFKLQKCHHFVKNHNGYFLVPIKAIESKDFKGKVYNFQVGSEPNSYLVKGFSVHNCGAAIATSSMVTELVKGKTIDEALKISNRAVAEALGGLPPIKMHCSVLAEEALKSAIEDYLKKRGKKKS